LTSTADEHNVAISDAQSYYTVSLFLFPSMKISMSGV